MLEYLTLGWNVVGVVVLAIAAFAAGSIALADFGLDSLIEIGASTVVVWQLTGTAAKREHIAMRLIGAAFIALAIQIAAQSIYVVLSVVDLLHRHSVFSGRASRASRCWDWRLAKPELVQPSTIMS